MNAFQANKTTENKRKNDKYFPIYVVQFRYNAYKYLQDCRTIVKVQLKK